MKPVTSLFRLKPRLHQSSVWYFCLWASLAIMLALLKLFVFMPWDLDENESLCFWMNPIQICNHDFANWEWGTFGAWRVPEFGTLFPPDNRWAILLNWFKLYSTKHSNSKISLVVGFRSRPKLFLCRPFIAPWRDKGHLLH